jgi:succinate dehydrogenase / fumarate reductase iron-sulfur subunit
MNTPLWTITVRIARTKADQPTTFDSFTLEVDPAEYVLDAIERIWAQHDRSLVFRHACHHATCGACGMRVCGVEKLTCITPISAVTHNGGTMTVEPLRNFPVISDLAVDMTRLYATMEQLGFREVVPMREAPNALGHDGIAPDHNVLPEAGLRLVDCIECGLCMSACPVAATDDQYFGPAALAALHSNALLNTPVGLAMADNHEGLWRCHNAFACTAVCPSFVEPAWRIMEARKHVVQQRLAHLFGRDKEIAP